MKALLGRAIIRSPRTVWREQGMRVTAHTIFGVIFVALGILAVIHPNFTLPGKKDEVTIANQRVVIETHRVVSIPRAASATEVALGLGLIFFGSLKPKR